MKFNRFIFNNWCILILVALSATSCDSRKKKNVVRSYAKYNEIERLQFKLSAGKSKNIIQQGNNLLNKYERDSDSLGICQTCELIARTYYFQQEIDQAIFYWKKGLRILPRDQEDLNATFASNIGAAYLFKGYQRTAISYFLEARRIFVNIKKQTNNYWVNYLNIGVCYMELNDFESASKSFKSIPYVGNPALDVIVPINLAKLYGLQSDKKHFNKYIKIALKNKKNMPIYIPILKEVQIEFSEKLGTYLELQSVFSNYKHDYGQVSTAFDLYLWKASIKLGHPIGSLVDLQLVKDSINKLDFYLLNSYYRVLAEFYASVNDFKNAFISKDSMEYCEKKSKQKDGKDKLYDYTLLSKRNEIRDALKYEQQLNNVQRIKLRNRSIILYFLLAIFLLLIFTVVLIFNNQRKKDKLNKNQLIIQDLELKLAKKKQNKLEINLEFYDKKLHFILETVSKIAILKKQLDKFFTILEKTSELTGMKSKSLIKEAKLDFHLFFNNYQDLAVLSNLVEVDSSKVILIRKKYPELKENEFRVLLLIIQNYTSKEMGILLSCTEKNIEYYRAQIRQKLSIQKDLSIKDFINNKV